MIRFGQEVEMTESKEVKTVVGERVMHIKEGDRALVTLNGLRYITGEAYGKLAPLQEIPKGFDVDNIARRIAKNLVLDLGGQDFKEYLIDMELTMKDIEDSILEELCLYLD